MTEILLTGSLSLNSINKQVMLAVIGLIAMIFDSKTINIFANSFIKNPNPFIKNQLSIIRTVKNLLPKYVTDSLPPVFGYKLQPSLSERVIVDGHGCHTALHFGVKAKENQDKVPTLYWLPKLHKNPYKARFIILILVLVRQQNFLNY